MDPREATDAVVIAWCLSAGEWEVVPETAHGPGRYKAGETVLLPDNAIKAMREEYAAAHAAPTEDSVLREYGLSPSLYAASDKVRAMASEIARHRRPEWVETCAATISSHLASCGVLSVVEDGVLVDLSSDFTAIILKHARGES